MPMLKWLSNRQKPRARLPTGTRIYAIGDIHGCQDLVVRAFELIDADVAHSQARQVIHVFLGDYVDRGPNTLDTINHLIKRTHTHNCVFLMGNHEALFLNFLRRPEILEGWRNLGGLPTLASYGVRLTMSQEAHDAVGVRDALLAAMPVNHHTFLQNLQTMFSCGDFAFVHAGIRPNVPLDRQSDNDLLWIREPFLSSREWFSKLIVHGHTPVREPDVRPRRINIDTGAYATGRLTTLVIEDDQIGFLIADRSPSSRSAR
jgi:serine/threonine protein phosphatase 1